MMSLVNILALLASLYVSYIFFKFFFLSDDEYNRYRKEGLSGGFIKTLFGENKVKREGALNGISRNMKTGKINKKASYSPEHTKRLFSK